MTEITRAPAQRDDQVIVAEHAGLARHGARRDVDVRHLGEVHVEVRDVGEDAADRLRDLGRRQPRRRHLVKQRLEQVVVLPVDQHDFGRLMAESLAERQAPETSPEDDDARRSLHAAMLHGAAPRGEQ